jgi:hypothetical protein
MTHRIEPGDDSAFWRAVREDDDRPLIQDRNACPCGSGEYSEWEYDAQGIELCRCCDKCRKEKLSHYRPEILTGYSQADVDESIEEDL